MLEAERARAGCPPCKLLNKTIKFAEDFSYIKRKTKQHIEYCGMFKTCLMIKTRTHKIHDREPPHTHPAVEREMGKRKGIGKGDFNLEVFFLQQI